MATLEKGAVPIYEPNLDQIVSRNLQAKRLSFTGNIGDAVRFGDAIFLCVGTPPLQSGDADLSAIDASARLIVAEARGSKLVIEKSTVPTQTGQQLKRALSIYARNSGSGYSFSVASNPEFLREGTAVLDFLHPNRIVIGTEHEAAEAQLREIYRPVLEQNFLCAVHKEQCPHRVAPLMLVTSINSAELIKHACNTFLALKISYANLIADICERMGANVDEVVEAMGLDPRIGSAFLRPGLGFGGFCLPKDIQAFIKVGERANVDVTMLKAVQSINDRRVAQFLEKVRQALWVIRNKRIGVLGTSFKPDTDDIRLSPAIALVSQLLEQGAVVQAYDPQAMDNAKVELPSVSYCGSAYEAANNAEALVIATDWIEFKDLDWTRIKEVMARPLILDGRNLLEARLIEALGFEYHGVGREVHEPMQQSMAQTTR
jgi:UDPglucose 6-dehydrogenase